MNTPKIRAVGILIKTDELLLIRRNEDGKEFWVLPGGGVEKNEKVEDAVIREIEEEASIKCAVIKLLYTHQYSDIKHQQFYYLCRYVSGTPQLGNFNEFQTMKNGNHVYEPTWVKIEKLPKMLIYPLEIRDWLVEDYKNNFKETPRTKILRTVNLRQKI